MAWFGFGLTWLGLTWLGLAWLGLAWCGSGLILFGSGVVSVLFYFALGLLRLLFGIVMRRDAKGRF